MARGLDLHPTVVRRHLEDLQREGLVDRASSAGGARGRPRQIYRLTASGRDAVGSRYDVVLRLLTDSALELEGPGTSERLFRRVARSLARASGPTTDRSCLGRLRELGFHPELRAGGELVSRNCPLLQLARAHPKLTCDTFHTELLRALLGTRGVRLRASIARGAEACLHEVPLGSLGQVEDPVLASS